jgi:hypothetical protein
MIQAKLIFPDRAEDIELPSAPEKTHDFVTKDAVRWSVDSIYWVQESVSPSLWRMCIKLKK